MASLFLYALFGAPHTGHFQESGKVSNGTPVPQSLLGSSFPPQSMRGSYTCPQTEQRGTVEGGVGGGITSTSTLITWLLPYPPGFQLGTSNGWVAPVWSVARAITCHTPSEGKEMLHSQGCHAHLLCGAERVARVHEAPASNDSSTFVTSPAPLQALPKTVMLGLVVTVHRGGCTIKLRTGCCVKILVNNDSGAP